MIPIRLDNETTLKIWFAVKDFNGLPAWLLHLNGEYVIMMRTNKKIFIYRGVLQMSVDSYRLENIISTKCNLLDLIKTTIKVIKIKNIPFDDCSFTYFDMEQ